MTETLLGPEHRGLTFATMTTIAVAAYNNMSVSAALPAIGDDLGNLSLLPWIVTIELITAAIAVLAVGPIIDSVGTQAVFRVSLVGFVITCVLCAFAPNIATLIVARGLQGLASGAIIANVMTAVGLGVPEALRPRSFAANSSVWGIMGVGGPAIAALVLTFANWSWIFLVNLPVAAFAGIVGWNAFPGPTEDSIAAPADKRGLLIVIAFTLLSLGAVSSFVWWTPIAVVLSGGFVWLYVRHEPTVEPPLLRLRHITSSTYRTLHVTSFLVITSAIAANTFLPIYVKGARGASAAEAAFAVVFLTLGWTVGAFASSRVAELWKGELALLVSAALLSAASTVAATAVWLELSLWFVFVAFSAMGIGLGGVSNSGLGLLQEKAIPKEMGRLNSAHQFIRTLGFTYGAALGGAVLFGVVGARLGDVEVVRSLLGDDDVVADEAIVEALAEGFAWSTTLAAGITYLALAFALRLNRESRLGEPVT
ncbi:MAG: MFS transporter [Acidimicrobiia bacterium]|nr:MFS transporter [Acidimicrobiia bacterium]